MSGFQGSDWQRNYRRD